jgi:DNA gyrase subunit B
MSTDSILDVQPDLGEMTAAERHTAEASEQYGAGNVKHLKDAEHIRLRPGMYIGDTGTNGLHHLIYELVHNCVDEALAGYCHNINVTLHIDKSCSVSDDGRGIPVEVHPETGKSTLEMVMTMSGAGAKFDKGAYKVSAGLHGIGAKAVTALSEWVEVQVQRAGRTYTQEYERGKAITEVKDIGASRRTGTRVQFRPDPDIFHANQFDHSTLEVRFRELAFLNKGVGIRLMDELTGKEEVFRSEGGIAEFVDYINKSEDKFHPTISIDVMLDGVRVEVALQYTNSEEERSRCYTNNAYNPGGGTHQSGFRAALTRSLGAYGEKTAAFKDHKPIGEDFRKGLTAIISIQHPDPQFSNQTKEKLNNTEVEALVAGVVTEYLTRYLEEHPKDAGKIMKKVALEAEARIAARKLTQALRDRKTLLSGGGLPGKLFDCSTQLRDEGELFLVEGDSAGGSAEQGRDRWFQAILPLRGKPLNVEKARLENMLKNEEIKSLIAAIGVDIHTTLENDADEELPEGETRADPLKKLRYGKIIIMTDADVDGQHIRTLLLTFFYRQMPQLVARGHIYVARPPLFKVTEKKVARFVQTSEAMQEQLMARGLKNTRVLIHPRPESPAPTRRLEGKELEALLAALLALEDALITLERRGVFLPTFFARANERGLPMFRVNVGGREHWCNTRAEVEELRMREMKRLGRDLVVEEGAPGAVPADSFSEQELHEVRKVNQGLADLRAFDLDTRDLLAPERVAGREPLLRLRLENGDSNRALSSLRELNGEIRRLGERGLSITRFKGLGEMGDEELWDTTLDPEKRILLKVKLDDALKADEMFRTLMGEKVEPRRDFIYKYALDAKDLDLHGA